VLLSLTPSNVFAAFTQSSKSAYLSERMFLVIASASSNLSALGYQALIATSEICISSALFFIDLNDFAKCDRMSQAVTIEKESWIRY